MSENAFGPLFLKALSVTLPTALCIVLIVCSALCAYGTVKHASRIREQESMVAFKAAWRIWCIGLGALSLCGLASQINTVSSLIDLLGDTVKNALAQFLATTYLLPVAAIVWRAGVEILKRLSR